MKLRQLLLLFPLALVACAGQTYNASAGPMFARARGEVALQNVGGSLILGDNQNSVKGNLGLGDTQVVPYLRLGSDYERHRFRVHGLYIDEDGEGTLAGDFGGIFAGSQVQTKMQFYAVAANWAYELVRSDMLRFAAGAQVGLYGLEIAARSVAGREEVVTDVIVPMPYIEGEAFFGDLVLGANLGIMSADFGDASGRYWDFEAYARWQLTDQFDLKGGYRYLLLDGAGTASSRDTVSSRDFDADVDVQGLFISAGVRF